MGAETPTKGISRIYVGDNLMDQLVREERKKRLIDLFEAVREKFYKVTDSMWVKIENKDVYYVDKYRMLIADITRKEYPRDRFISAFAGYKGRLPSYDETYDLFFINKQFNPLVDSKGRLINYNNVCEYIAYDDNYRSYKQIGIVRLCNGWSSSGFDEDYDSVKIPIYTLKETNKLCLFLQENLIPSGFEKDEEKLLEWLSILYQNEDLGVLIEDSKVINLTFKESFTTNTFVSEVLSGEYDTLNNTTFRKEDIIEFLKSQKQQLTASTRSIFAENYLNSDYIRAEIEPYDANILEDIERGHWDLWEVKDAKGTSVEVTDPFIARNPLADIQQDGVVGIDFGTKSTVVVCQNGDDNIMPMRVGSGKYKNEIRKEDYENPTVMEFRNIEAFMASYREKEGRPETRWEDLTVSHTAAGQLSGTKESSSFYSFFGELKQWCGDKKRRIRIVDNQGHEESLPAFLDIQEGEFDPIELYAYYLGLYINNMRQKIYMNYLLSFPVTYEKAVKEKIVESFERGLKKSLPQAVLEDQGAMEMFRVRQWSSEPAAYAICALKEYGFEPEGDEKVFYGIFDFGGGTTDFDFGIWKSADAKQRRKYDYVIEHFGAGGDQYLGGENLLELLAFHVFKENKEALLGAGIPFYKPHDCENFVGSEDLLYDSQEARLNIRQLMEKLRGLWQRDDDEAIEAIESGTLKALLFTKSGEHIPGFELQVDREELEQLLYDRIQQGVKNFFAAMVQTFTKDDLKDAKTLNIFLAGNSSKSEIVKELFQQYSRDWTRQIKEKYQDESFDEENNSIFRVFPPLGTEEERNEEDQADEEEELRRPTGKTGVAYGLILGSPSSRIKVKSEISNDKEVKFKYYIGYGEKGRFETVMDREKPYYQWVWLTYASERDFEFYYTSLADDHLNKSSVAKMRKKLCMIGQEYEDEDVLIFIRAVAPTAIEYAVATEEGIEREEYIEGPKRVDLP